MQALSQLSYTPSRSMPIVRSKTDDYSDGFVRRRDPQARQHGRAVEQPGRRRARVSAHDRRRARARPARAAASSGRARQRLLHRPCRDGRLLPGRVWRACRASVASAGRTASVTCCARSAALARQSAKSIASQSASSPPVLQRSRKTAHARSAASSAGHEDVAPRKLRLHEREQAIVGQRLEVVRVDPVRAWPRPTAPGCFARWLPSNQATICSREKISSSPWLQPRRAR